MIDRNNWIAVRQFHRDHERQAGVLRRALRSIHRKMGIIGATRVYAYDSVPNIASPARMRSEVSAYGVTRGMVPEIAPDFDMPRGRGFFDGNFLTEVLR